MDNPKLMVLCAPQTQIQGPSLKGESIEYDQQQHFKAIPILLLNEVMKANLAGLYPFTIDVMKTRLPQR